MAQPPGERSEPLQYQTGQVAKMREQFQKGLDSSKQETAKKANRVSVGSLPTKEAPPEPQHKEVHAKAGKPNKESKKMPPPILQPKPKMPAAAETPQKPTVPPKPTIPPKPAIASKPKTEAAPQQIVGSKVAEDIVEKSKPKKATYEEFLAKFNSTIAVLPPEAKAVMGSNAGEFLTKQLENYVNTLGLSKLLGTNVVDIENAIKSAGFDNKQLFEILYGDQKDSDQYRRLGEAIAKTLVDNLETADNKTEAKQLLKDFVSLMEGDRLNDTMKSSLLQNKSSAQWKNTTKPLADGFMTHLRSKV